MKISDRDRKIVLIDKPHQKTPANPKGEVRLLAEKYGLHPDTLRQRKVRYPDVPLEQLAKGLPVNRKRGVTEP